MIMTETLEEAAIRLVPNRTLKSPFGTPYEITPNRERNTFIKGAKWQQERSYSEEEVLKIIELSRQIKEGKELFDLDSIRGLTEICTHNWEILSEEKILEQFKKK